MALVSGSDKNAEVYYYILVGNTYATTSPFTASTYADHVQSVGVSVRSSFRIGIS